MFTQDVQFQMKFYNLTFSIPNRIFPFDIGSVNLSTVQLEISPVPRFNIEFSSPHERRALCSEENNNRGYSPEQLPREFR